MLLYLCILSVWITSKTTLTTTTSTTSMSSSSLSSLSSTRNSTTVKVTGNVVDEDGRDLRIAPSKACLRKRGSMEFQEFCQACRTNTQHGCQQRTFPRQEQQQTTAKVSRIEEDGRRKRMIRRSDSVDTFANNNSSSTSSVSSSSRCKTIWITGMSMGFETKHAIADGGDGYAMQYAAALRSYQVHANQVFQPVLVLMTPNVTTTTTPQEQPSSLASRYTRWLEQQGVIVIQIHTLSFQELVFQAYPQYAKNGAIAYYLRFDLPKILLESQYSASLFDRPEICGRTAATATRSISNNNPSITSGGNGDDENNVVFYIDSDVLFVRTVEHDDIKTLKGKLTREKFLMYGQDFLIDRPKPSNTGVMFIHLEGFRDEWPNILHWGEQQLTRYEQDPNNANHEFPKHDQLWLNAYYVKPKKWKAQNLLLPPEWNWKVYWAMHIDDGNPKSYGEEGSSTINDTTRRRTQQQQQLPPIKLIHFHGPKPQDGVGEIARCDTDAVVSVRLDATTKKNNSKTSSSSKKITSSPQPRLSSRRFFHPDYESFVSHGMCCDLGKTAAWVLQLYDRWKPTTIPWIQNLEHNET